MYRAALPASGGRGTTACRIERPDPRVIRCPIWQGSSAAGEGLHKPCVAGSNPAPATTYADSPSIVRPLNVRLSDSGNNEPRCGDGNKFGGDTRIQPIREVVVHHAGHEV